MEKGINLQIEEFKQNIVKVINESKMPIAVAELTMQNLLVELNATKQQLVAKEKQEYESSLKEEKDKK